MTTILFKSPSLFMFSTDEHIIDNNFKKCQVALVSGQENIFNMFNEPKMNKGKTVNILSFLQYLLSSRSKVWFTHCRIRLESAIYGQAGPKEAHNQTLQIKGFHGCPLVHLQDRKSVTQFVKVLKVAFRWDCC